MHGPDPVMRMRMYKYLESQVRDDGEEITMTYGDVTFAARSVGKGSDGSLVCQIRVVEHPKWYDGIKAKALRMFGAVK